VEKIELVDVFRYPHKLLVRSHASMNRFLVKTLTMTGPNTAVFQKLPMVRCQLFA